MMILVQTFFFTLFGAKSLRLLDQGSLTDGVGSVQLTSFGVQHPFLALNHFIYLTFHQSPKRRIHNADGRPPLIQIGFVNWSNGKLTKQQVDQMATWSNCNLSKLQLDQMATWSNGNLIKWQLDQMATWPNGNLIKWQLDQMANWPNGNLT